MVTDAAPLQLLIALAAMALVAAAEWMHARRVAQVAHLAFGDTARPAAWTRAAGVVRTVGASLAAWGFLFLMSFDPVEVEKAPSKAASSHLLVLLDVSPSMQLVDSQGDGKKISRAQRAGLVVQGILDRLDMESTRITLVAFYTKALPILQDTFDKELISNALDGLPMHVAFESGPTDLQQGLTKGFELARLWPADSATLLVLTDGDVTATKPTNMPSSIADTIIVGLGDPLRGMVVNGHSSRQDSMGLRQLALRLGGHYHDGNRQHLPSDVIANLTMIAPRVGGNWSMRDIALASVATGCVFLSSTGILLLYFGRPRTAAFHQSLKEHLA